MKNRRLGNDFDVAWSIVMENGQPFDLEEGKVSLYLSNAVCKTNISEFSIEKNVIKWTFKGRDQKHPGIHALTLIVNEGNDNMRTVDYCKFVNLVDCSCKISGEDDSGVSTDGIELQSTLEMGGKTYAHKIYALNGIINSFKDKGLDFLLEELVVITPEYGRQSILDSTAFKYIVEKYNLSQRQNRALPCFFKREKSDPYQLGTLFYREMPNGMGLKMDISYQSCTTPTSEEAISDGSIVYSPDIRFTTNNISYLFDPNSNYIVPLGLGSVNDDSETLQGFANSIGELWVAIDLIETSISRLNTWTGLK